MYIVPKLAIILLLSGALGLCIYFKDKRKYINAIVICLLVAYIWMLLSITLIGREKLAVRSAVLCPGYSYRHIFDYPWFYATDDSVAAAIGNVIMFIPLGMIICYLIRTRHPYLVSGMVSFAISASIEVTQYVTQLGSLETDDIIHNTWGAVIGCAVTLVLINKEQNFKAIFRRLLPLWAFMIIIIMDSVVSVMKELIWG